MTGAEEVVVSVIIISTISNFLVDLFGEVFLEYGVYYTRGYWPEFSIPGFGQRSSEASATMDSATLSAMIERISHTPQLLEKLSVEQLEMLNTVLVSMQVAG